MKSVSQAYRNSMADVFRGQSEVRIVLGNIVSFTGDVIKNVVQINDVDPISRRLPTETLEFSVIDENGNYNPNSQTNYLDYIGDNATVTLKFGYHVGGTVEWLESDNYVLSGRPSYDNGSATFRATKKLATLTGTFYKGVFSNSGYTYKSLAISVLIDAGVSDYEIDDYLALYSSYAPIPIDTHKNCLQMIAHACGCALYTNSQGKITIKHKSFLDNPLPNFTLNQRDVVDGSETVSKIPPLYKVESYKHDYKIDSSLQEIYSEEITIDSPINYHVEYEPAKTPMVYIDGSVISSSSYARSSDFELTRLGKNEISILGYRATKSDSVYTKLITTDSNSEIEKIDNPLITDYSVNAILAENTGLYLQYRTTNRFQYRGNPELEALDIIKYSSQYGDDIKCMVLKNTITYNGVLSGEIILKNLSDRNTNTLLSVDSQVSKLNRSIEENT